VTDLVAASKVMPLGSGSPFASAIERVSPGQEVGRYSPIATVISRSPMVYVWSPRDVGGVITHGLTTVTLNVTAEFTLAPNVEVTITS